ncbi:MAG: tRNA (N6-isopentenyl adenosine(37)-C2)-methylthiotransferase MiaB [Sedimentisphaerales bacterium]|nr:tRNA (N6-isopentenyl adenosine(37)-C2)-methylthiotransferase MiaB [Sedimentisphaerales bacterium]
MNRRKFHIKNFGCQMNKLDAALVASALQKSGFILTEHAREADVVLINTCSVRQHAEDRVLSHLGHLKHMKENRPELVVAVMGCMAQRLGTNLLSHEAVDIVAGPAQLPEIPRLIEQVLTQGTKTLAVTDKIRTITNPEQSEALDTFEYAYDSDVNHIPGQAFVRAMRGCNQFCSYCVVPYVRGPEVSRPPHAIIEQIKKLADQGVRQVTLLGQTINSYSYRDGDRQYGLANLLEMTSRIEGVEWIRFITSHPGHFDDAILHAMADLEKVCPYLHIPAQSGSDRILKAMNRGYTARQYLDLLIRARQIVPEIAIAGDFIVGFPGETEADFEATVYLVREARYKNCFVFKYSPRPGTRADSKLADTVQETVKKERNLRLLDVQNEINEIDNQQFVGQVIKVLVEGLSKKPHLNQANEGGMPQLIGRTATDFIVVFNGPESLAGQFANIHIEKAGALTLFGMLVE